eukprot:1955204-Rhodomonas_salina.1
MFLPGKKVYLDKTRSRTKSGRTYWSRKLVFGTSSLAATLAAYAMSVPMGRQQHTLCQYRTLPRQTPAYAMSVPDIAQKDSSTRYVSTAHHRQTPAYAMPAQRMVPRAVCLQEHETQRLNGTPKHARTHTQVRMYQERTLLDPNPPFFSKKKRVWSWTHEGSAGRCDIHVNVLPLLDPAAKRRVRSSLRRLAQTYPLSLPFIA